MILMLFVCPVRILISFLCPVLETCALQTPILSGSDQDVPVISRPAAKNGYYPLALYFPPKNRQNYIFFRKNIYSFVFSGLSDPSNEKRKTEELFFVKIENKSFARNSRNFFFVCYRKCELFFYQIFNQKSACQNLKIVSNIFFEQTTYYLTLINFLVS